MKHFLQASAGDTDRPSRWASVLLWAAALLLLASPAAWAKRDAFFEGLELMAKARYRKAITFFEQASREDPKHAPTYSRLAECHEHLGQYRQALPCWRAYANRKAVLADTVARHIELLALMETAEAACRSGTPLPTHLRQLSAVAADRYRGSVIAGKACELLLPHLVERRRYRDALAVATRLWREFPSRYTLPVILDHARALRCTGAAGRSIRLLDAHAKRVEATAEEADALARELALGHLELALQAARQACFGLARERYEAKVHPARAHFAAPAWQKVAAVWHRIRQLEVTTRLRAAGAAVERGDYRPAGHLCDQAAVAAGEDAVLATRVARARWRLQVAWQAERRRAAAAVGAGDWSGAAAQLLDLAGRLPRAAAWPAVRDGARYQEIAGQPEAAVEALAGFVQRHAGTREAAAALYLAGVILEAQARLHEAAFAFQQLMQDEANPYARRFGELGGAILLLRQGKGAAARQCVTQAAMTYHEDTAFVALARQTLARMKACREFHAVRQ